jgi:hypothetical protein
MYDAMVHRIIISPALQRQQSTTINQVRNTTRTVDDIVLYCRYLIPPVVLAVATKYNSRIDKNNTYSWMYVLVTAAAVTLIAMFKQRKANGKEVQAVALYPLGIQLGTLAVDNTSTNERLIPREFLHRETVVDCVVTEVVHSYKVQSAVMLRTAHVTVQSLLNNDRATKNGQDGTTGSNKGDIFTRTRNSRDRVNCLIRLFTDVEMTYVECLTIRSQINMYLQRNDKAV